MRRPPPDGTFHPNPQECEATFAEGVSRHIRDLGPHEWRVAHAHLTNTYLNESEGLLYQWRAAVEAQGCELVNTGNRCQCCNSDAGMDVISR